MGSVRHYHPCSDSIGAVYVGEVLRRVQREIGQNFFIIILFRKIRFYKIRYLMQSKFGLIIVKDEFKYIYKNESCLKLSESFPCSLLILRSSASDHRKLNIPWALD